MEELYAAFASCEDGEVSQLHEWCKAHESQGSGAELRIVDKVLDSHKGKQLSNMGSPLYIACVCDQPCSVRFLLSQGSDPNYVHPDHGDSPLLHCCGNGYSDCLRILLADPGLHARDSCTVDRKIFLGQGLPQYEEGGRSPLQLCAVHARVDEMKLLLSTQDAAHWLEQQDSFGRTVVKATLDQIALLAPGTQKQEDLLSVLRLLCEAIQQPLNDVLQQLPSSEQAGKDEINRNRILRARCLQAQESRRAEQILQGKQAIARWYQPKHPELFSGSFQPAQLAEDMHSTSPLEPHPGVFSFSLLSELCCAQIWDELHRYEAQACAHPEQGLPLTVRHDGNFGCLQECGFAALLEALQEVCEPFVKENLPQLGQFQIYHAFVTRNYVGRDENATFKMHCDKSDLTFNICLHASEGFQGSTVGFYSNSSEEGCTPSESDREYTHVHSVGRCVFHNGGQWHKTDPITAGTRGSLIAWAKLCNPRPRVGDLVKLASTARLREGVLANGSVGVLKEDDGVSRQPFLVSSRDGHQTTWYHTHDLLSVAQDDELDS